MSLSPLRLPSEPGAWLGWVSERATGGLTDAGAQVAALKEAPPGDEAILQLWNESASRSATSSPSAP